MADETSHWFTADEIRWLFGLDLDYLEERRLILSIRDKSTDQPLYPAYQFDPGTGQPWAVIGILRRQFEQAELQECLPIWLEEPSSAFRGEPPACRLGRNPEEVVSAAARFLDRHETFQVAMPAA